MITILKKLFSFFERGERLKVLIIFSMMIAGSLMEIVGIGSIPAFLVLVMNPEKVLAYPQLAFVFDILNIQDSKSLLITGSLSLIVIFILKNVFLSYSLHYRTRFIFDKLVKVGDDLFFTYLQAPYTYHLNHNSAELQRNVGDVRKVISVTMISLLTAVMDAILVFAVVILLLLVEPLVTMATFVFFGLMGYLFMRFIRKKLDHFGNIQLLHNTEFIRAIREGLGGIKEVLVLNRENYFLKEFAEHNKELAKGTRYLQVASMLPKMFIETLAVTAMLSVTLFLVVRGYSLESVVPMLLLFGSAAVRLMPAFNSILSNVSNIQFNIPMINALDEKLKELKKITIQRKSNTGNRLAFNSDIRIQDLEYTYPNTVKKILNGVSLTIPKGSVVGFVGSSGAGKTTMVDILLGLLPPSKGGIYVDDVSIEGDMVAWQSNLGYIPQAIFLADDTIQRNIALGIDDKEVDMKLLTSALKAAQLDKLIEELPEGLQTFVGEAGVRLSGGQRQRIGIARALYHNPQVLIMDEATSALDNITEKFVIEAIERLRGERTIIMIAHRLTTVKNCDMLYFMRNGKIEDMGTYDELLEKNAEFRHMALEIHNE